MLDSYQPFRSRIVALSVLLVHLLRTLPTARALSSSELRTCIGTDAMCNHSAGSQCGVELRQLKVVVQHSGADAAKEVGGLAKGEQETSGLIGGSSRAKMVEARKDTANAQQTLVAERASKFLSKSSGQVTFAAFLAEYVGTALFVFIGCGHAMTVKERTREQKGYSEEIEDDRTGVLQISLAFGFSIAVLGYSIFHYSGGQMNVAVTMALVIHGKCNALQGFLNFIAQILGASSGAFLLTLVFPKDKDYTATLASNSIKTGWSRGNVLAGEMIMTFTLVFVVLETATNPLAKDNREIACLAIGLAVTVAHLVLVPVDGCSINPSRSFGTAVFARMHYNTNSTLQDLWVFWVGPLLCSLLACAMHGIFRASTASLH